MDDCSDKTATEKCVAKFDLLKGYWYIPLSEKANKVSVFVTPDGLYQSYVMPFDMKNAPATFQRLVNNIITDLDNADGCIDGVIIYNASWCDRLL